MVLVPVQGGLQLGCFLFTLLVLEVIAFGVGGRGNQAYYTIYMAKMNLRFSLQPLDSCFLIKYKSRSLAWVKL